MKNKLYSIKKNAGFTLLELVVVVAVMGLISTMAMDVYTDHSNQKRFEATKQRLAEIKFAIIGDPMMRVGSQAVLTGFFNDMGRYPRNLKELITANPDGFCLHDTDYSVSTTAVNATACANLTVGSWSWKTDDSTNWKGPYLHNIQSSGSNLVFQDAWGNSGGNNFGWLVNFPSGSMKIQSLALDRASTGTNNYEVDYPETGNLINKAELDRIMQLKDLVPSAGYCINTLAVPYKIDLNYLEPATCDPVANRDWADFL